MAAKHVRLESDVAEMVATVSKRNSRSTAKEVNHVLREHYTAELVTGIGQSGDGSALRFQTVLDPKPRTRSKWRINPAWKNAEDIGPPVTKPRTHAENRKNMRG